LVGVVGEQQARLLGVRAALFLVEMVEVMAVPVAVLMEAVTLVEGEAQAGTLVPEEQEGLTLEMRVMAQAEEVAAEPAVGAPIPLVPVVLQGFMAKVLMGLVGCKLRATARGAEGVLAVIRGGLVPQLGRTLLLI
jgi:hypothetical protein